MYDEGPLYVFAKNEDVRSRWIKTLKDSQCIYPKLILSPLVVSEHAREKFSFALPVRSGALQQGPPAEVPSLFLDGRRLAVLPPGGQTSYGLQGAGW